MHGTAAPIAAVGGNADLDFESGLRGWTAKGDVTIVDDSSSAQAGSRFARLAPGSSISRTITGIAQGSYTLSTWIEGQASNNTSSLLATGTGAPDATSLLDSYLGGDGSWTQMAHRNVLVYNGQVTITITAGTSSLNVDSLALTLDAPDANPIQNWGLENGLAGWTHSPGAVTVVHDGADTGHTAVRLAADGEISQTVPVEPNTRYVVTARAKVEKEDTYSTTASTDSFGTTGGVVSRTSTGDRINVGVRNSDGTVLRQAPAATDGYSLVSISFTTGPDQHEATVYANTTYDQAYKDSVGVFQGDDASASPADDWTGNGDDSAWVDNFDMFTLGDPAYLRGADVSNLQPVEDHGGKYFANGVQQDALRILSNRGVNSVTSMIFVHAGEPLYDQNLHQILNTMPDGSSIDKLALAGYFDKVHTVAMAKRAAALGLSYLPSFHESDYFMSSSKASTPYEWLDQNPDGTLANSDISHLKSIVYNYVYDMMSAVKSTGADIVGVKEGNEENNGLIWPVGKGATSANHAAILAATHDAVEAVMPGLSGYAHTDNGYSTSAAQTFFEGLLAKGAKFDGAGYSLYGGHATGSILNMAQMMNDDPQMRYLDYVNVETGASFTKLKATWSPENYITPASQYYRVSPDGQYNWLLDYAQAPLDVPNPYGKTRGFYYWEIDWIPTPGAGSKQNVPVDISSRTMFNNGDTSIHAMGDSQPGKIGDMLDSMNAYLMRGIVKDKPVGMHSPLDQPGTAAPYAVDATTVQGIQLTNGAMSLTVGDVQRLKPVLTPSDRVVTDGAIGYRSSDPRVATVTHDGFVHAVQPGNVTITASTGAGGSIETSVPVSVAAPTTSTPGSLAVQVGGTTIADGATIDVKAGDKLQLTTTLPNATDQTLEYRSSNPDAASFFGETWQTPKGRLHAYAGSGNTVQLNVTAAGESDITVAAADGGATVTIHLRG